MSRRSGSNIRDALEKDWRRWTDVIELIVRTRSPRPRVDVRDYEGLHRRIIAACRELAGAGDEAGRVFFEGLEAIARPWLSPTVLAHTDRVILGHLLDRCRQIEREFEARARSRVLRRLAAPVLLLAVATVAAVIGWTARDLWPPFAGDLQDGWNAIGALVGRSSDLEKLFALVVVVILVSIYNVSRTARS